MRSRRPGDGLRTRILTAATEIACDHGGASLTAVAISSRAGVSIRTFGCLFDDPLDCALAAFDDALTLATSRASAAYNVEGCWPERVRAGLAALLEFADERPSLAQFCVVQAPAVSPALLMRCRRQSEAFVRVIDADAPSTGGVRPWTAGTVVGHVLGAVHARLCPPSEALVPALNELMEMIVSPYLGPETARREHERQ